MEPEKVRIKNDFEKSGSESVNPSEGSIRSLMVFVEALNKSPKEREH